MYYSISSNRSELLDSLFNYFTETVNVMNQMRGIITEIRAEIQVQSCVFNRSYHLLCSCQSDNLSGFHPSGGVGNRQRLCPWNRHPRLSHVRLPSYCPSHKVIVFLIRLLSFL